MRRYLAEFVFWLHLLLVGLVAASGFWLSFWMVTLMLIGHRIQFWFFRGCLLSHLQHKLKPFPENMGFLQYAWYRLTGMKISFRQEMVLDAAIVCAPILVSLIKK